LALVAVSLRGADPPGAVISLFNGKDLDGWVVTDCQVGVENGALVLQDGNGLVRSHHKYKDFVLELDWKARKAEMYDSGIYIRADLPVPPRQWPARYQINLKDGFEGNVTTIKDAASTGLVKRGQWNHFKIRVVGNTASLEINGKPAWTTDKLESPTGYIGFQSEVPLGGQFEFKNITMVELGHVSLFNGRDLQGWESSGGDASATWKIEDGQLALQGGKGPWLRSAAQYGDFNLRLDYRVNTDGNSGVYVRVPSDGNHHGPKSGLEIQLLDDDAPRHASLKPFQYSSGLYDIIGPSQRVSRPAGQWNSIEINCRGQHYTITHNGIPVIDTDDTRSPLLAERLTAGFIGLQNHGSRAWFRNIRIGDAM
jgi:hypothetical protein